MRIIHHEMVALILLFIWKQYGDSAKLERDPHNSCEVINQLKISRKCFEGL